jgi:hypothetical protein
LIITAFSGSVLLFRFLIQKQAAFLCRSFSQVKAMPVRGHATAAASLDFLVELASKDERIFRAFMELKLKAMDDKIEALDATDKALKVAVDAKNDMRDLAHKTIKDLENEKVSRSAARFPRVPFAAY